MNVQFSQALAGMLGVTAMAGVSPAAITPISGNAADYRLTSPGTGAANTTLGNVEIGTTTTGATTVNYQAFLIFALPTLATGNSIGDQTSLSINLNVNIGTANFNADVWGVGDFPTATTAVNYFYIGDAATNVGNNNATASDAKLVNNFFTSATALGVQSTPTGAGNNLQAYLQGFYAANPTYDASTGQRYAFFRLNPDATPTALTQRYRIDSANAATVPVLNLDVVPEPASLGLVGVAAIGLLARHRKES